MSVVALNPQATQQVLAARAALAARARYNINDFIEYAMRSEEDGQLVLQAPIHEEWQALADVYPRLVIWGPPGAGKTNQFAIGRTLFALGHNPNLRAAVVSKTFDLAEKIVSTASRYIEANREVHEVFPSLVPGDVFDPDEYVREQRRMGSKKHKRRSEKWTGSAIVVKRSNPYIKEPSFQAFGLGGSPLGARLDLLILEDVLDFTNTTSDKQREEIFYYIKSNLLTRLGRNSRVIVIGNMWHPDDAMHRLAGIKGWVSKSFPIVDQQGNSQWPEMFPPERIAELRDEFGTAEFARLYMCMPRDDSAARFKKDWVQKAIDRGKGKRLALRLNVLPHGYKTYCGVDLAVQKHASADLVAFATVIVAPDGTRELLALESGHLEGPDILDKIVDIYNNFKPIFVVENVAAQDYINQFVKRYSAIPIVPFTTGGGRASLDFQTQGLAVEMERGKWVIPSEEDGSTHPEIEALVRELLYYDPQKHCGDRLAALCFARHGANLTVPKIQVGRMGDMIRR